MAGGGLIVIPARGGSKRVPGKNLRPLGDMSLLDWTDRAVRQAGLSVPILLTTDDHQIAAAGRRLGWDVPFLRPAELATDDASTLDTVLHALDWRRDRGLEDPDWLLLLQVTSPFRKGETLRAGLAMLEHDTSTDAVIGVRRLPHGLAAVYRAGSEGYLVPAAAAPSDGAFVPNGAFYAIRTTVLRREKSFVPRRCLPLDMDDLESVDIDTPLDWLLAQAVIAEKGLL